MLRALSLLIPALFPSWRFFRDIAPSPRIEVRLPGSQDWQPLPAASQPEAARHLLARLAWSPGRAEDLYLVTLSERLVEAPTVHALREMTLRLCRKLGLSSCRGLRFRLVFVSREGDRLVRDVLYESPEAG